MKKLPLVSFIILNWNGKKWLQQCLPTVMKVTYPQKEIIVVNNGSTDDSAEFLRKNYPKVKVVELKKNIGYAGANNVGVRSAKGKYVFLLNNDTKVTPSFLTPLVDKMEKDPTIGVMQPQIRSMIYPDLLDSVGSFMTWNGFLYHFGYMKPWKLQKYQKPLYAYSIKGAAMMMRKKDYIYLGGLDEDFVCYVEETDLCHRVWLSGMKVVYDPISYVYHWGGGDMQVMTKDEVTMIRSFRNRVFSYIKNFGIEKLITLLPLYFLFSEIFVLAALIKGKWKNAIAAQLGILIWVKYLPQLRKKRRFIQQTIRKVSDKEIAPYITLNPRLSYYYFLSANIKGYTD